MVSDGRPIALVDFVWIVGLSVLVGVVVLPVDGEFLEVRPIDINDEFGAADAPWRLRVDPLDDSVGDAVQWLKVGDVRTLVIVRVVFPECSQRARRRSFDSSSMHSGGGTSSGSVSSPSPTHPAIDRRQSGGALCRQGPKLSMIGQEIPGADLRGEDIAHLLVGRNLRGRVARIIDAKSPA